MHYLATHAKPTQTEPLDSRQVENSASGFSYSVDVWTRLHRFLVLGSEGGSYYASEHRLTRENIGAIEAALAEDGPRAVREIARVSDEGRAAKNAPAVFALAVAAKKGDAKARRAAYDALPQVCRIATHLFQFIGYCELFGGWGRGLKRAVAGWYGRDVEQVAYQMAKYRTRGGWSHADVLRLAHPRPTTKAHDELFAWALGKGGPVTPHLEGLEMAAGADTATAARAIREYGLTREMVDPSALTSPEVWEALLEHIPYTALIRNLSTMSRVGLLTPGSSAVADVTRRLGDEGGLRKARVHPLSVLTALFTYRAGHGMRSEWVVVPQVVDALDDAFYKAFQNVEPTGKRIMLALDVSGSMTLDNIGGSPLTPRDASAAMALVTACTDPGYFATAFTDGLSTLPLSPRQRLDDVIQMVNGLRFGGTDCALPMLAAAQQGWEVDAFVVYTDSETWAGRVHPVEALREYRQKSGIDAKLIVVGMLANDFTIADPNDPGMLDVVGFDSAAPALIGDFIAGRV